MNISFSPPDISELEIAEVAEALRSGWITTGPRTKELERRIAEWVGTEKCVCLNSQTACAEMPELSAAQESAIKTAIRKHIRHF